MQTSRWFALALALAACPPSEKDTEPEAGYVDAPVTTPAPDDRALEEQRSGATLTPTDQGESEADRRITQRIRQAVVSDASLSMDAKNVQIITVDGKVTLRGSVKSAEERRIVTDMARSIAGPEKVDDQLEVAGG